MWRSCKYDDSRVIGDDMLSKGCEDNQIDVIDMPQGG